MIILTTVLLLWYWISHRYPLPSIIHDIMDDSHETMSWHYLFSIQPRLSAEDTGLETVCKTILECDMIT